MKKSIFTLITLDLVLAFTACSSSASYADNYKSTYTITFEANGGTGERISKTVEEGTTLNFSDFADAFKKDNATLLGFSTETLTTVFDKQEKYIEFGMSKPKLTVTKNVTYYAFYWTAPNIQFYENLNNFHNECKTVYLPEDWKYINKFVFIPDTTVNWIKIEDNYLYVNPATYISDFTQYDNIIGWSESPSTAYELKEVNEDGFFKFRDVTDLDFGYIKLYAFRSAE